MLGILYIVATPIGNLYDITLRAIDVLKSVDLILSEDTRVTRRLLSSFKIKTPTLSYHQHSKLKRTKYITQLLRNGKKLALVSDAGTPGISDPGNKLIKEVLKSLNDRVRITPIPGPSALTTIASISGFHTDHFLFLGFLPSKKKRRKFLEEIINSEYPVIFYESPYRIIKSLRDLRETGTRLDAKPARKIVVCREMTKKFETVYRGEIEEVIKKIENDKIRGEFTVIVDKNI